jgi:hypothetical protein
MQTPGGFFAALRMTVSVLCLLTSVLCIGCSHYQLGTDAKLSFRTLYVAPLEDKAHVPQARELIGTQIREAFARDARITLVDSSDAADATLTVNLTDYHREVSTAREDDTGLARKFNLTLGATCTLRDNRGARDFFAHRAVSVQRESFTDSGQLQSEYQTLPLLGEALAAKVTHAVLDVW